MERFEFRGQLPDLVQVRVEAVHDRRTGIHLEHVWDGQADLRDYLSTHAVCDLVIQATEAWDRLQAEPKVPA